MNILVLNPASEFAKNVVRDVLYGCWCGGKRIGGGTVPPFALIQAASVLKNDGHRVRFIDAQAQQLPFEALRPEVERADMVVMASAAMTFREDAAFLARVKEVNPATLTALFGAHPTFMPGYCLSSPAVDAVLRREPEPALRGLARALALGQEWRTVPGIAFRRDGQVVLNPDMPFMEDLDELPFPDVSFLPADIHYFNPIVRRLPYMTASTSRGCPGRCTFCTAPAFDGHRVRYQSADYVVREMEYFRAHGFREVYFRDDTFFVNKARDHEICRALIAKKADITWLAHARIGLIDGETMRLARQAGCHTLKFGVESGVQKILDRSHKGYRVEQAAEAFAWAREAGLRTHAHVMLGMPGDTEETLRTTVRWIVKKLKPSTATFGVCTPYPGTPLFDEVAAAFPAIRDGSASDFKRLHTEALYNTHFCDVPPDALSAWVRRAYRAFYLSPRVWAETLLSVRSADDLKKYLLTASHLFTFMMKGE
ncbi:MAG: radical SAM protein [Fibrobacterota bacterium]